MKTLIMLLLLLLLRMVILLCLPSLFAYILRRQAEALLEVLVTSMEFLESRLAFLKV
jgi:hypothetical protein